MIATNGQRVFDDKFDEKKEDLIKASKSMLESFYTTVEALSNGVPWYKVKRELPDLLSNYVIKFWDWKKGHNAKIINRLENLMDNMNGDAKSSEWEIVREKYKQIAGQDMLNAYDARRRAEGTKTENLKFLVAEDPAPLPDQPLSREAFVHMVLVGESFKIDDRSRDQFTFVGVAKRFNNLLFQALKNDLLEDPPDYSRVVSTLHGLSDNFMEFQPMFEVVRRIPEIINIEKIAEFLKSKRDDEVTMEECVKMFDAIFKVLVSMHEELKTPERRDETVKKWNELRENVTTGKIGKNQWGQACFITKAMEIVSERLHALRVDTNNHKLAIMAPNILRDGNGFQYLTNKFKNQVKKGNIGLAHTRTWLEGSVSTLIKDERIQFDESNLIRRNSEDLEKVIDMGIVLLVLGSPEDMMPETMQLVSMNLKVARRLLDTILQDSIVILTVDYIMRSVNMMCCGNLYTETLKKVQEIMAGNESVSIRLNVKYQRVMEILNPVIPPEKLETLIRMLKSGIATNSDVYKGMNKILRRTCFYLISLDGEKDNVPGKYGVPEVTKVMMPRIEECCERLAKIARVNKKVHLPWYNGIIRGIARDVESKKSV